MIMGELLELLKDGHARTVELLASELNTDVDDIERKLEYLERVGAIKRIVFCAGKCGSCSGCSAGDTTIPCKGCMPDGGFKNMGQMWEVV